MVYGASVTSCSVQSAIFEVKVTVTVCHVGWWILIIRINELRDEAFEWNFVPTMIPSK